MPEITPEQIDKRILKEIQFLFDISEIREEPNLCLWKVARLLNLVQQFGFSVNLPSEITVALSKEEYTVLLAEMGRSPVIKRDEEAHKKVKASIHSKLIRNKRNLE